MVSLGLEGLRKVVNPGLKALLEVCELGPARDDAPSTTEVAFRIAPRINAAGRMDVAKDVVELFTVKDAARAKELAARLDQLNSARQQEEQRISEAVLRQVEESAELRDAALHGGGGRGMASRRDRHLRLARGGALWASGGGDLPRRRRGAWLGALDSGLPSAGCAGDRAGAVSALRRTRRGGGICHARGECCASCGGGSTNMPSAKLSGEQLQPVLEFDGELTMEQVTPRFWEQLRALQPFGMGNPEPVFVARGVTLMGEPKVMREKHLKLKLRRYTGYAAPVQPARALWLADWMRWAGGWRTGWRLSRCRAATALDVLFRIEQNTHKDFGGGLQLVLSDFRRAVTARQERLS